MFESRTILYWFREPGNLPINSHGDSPFRDCSGLIPVFCFDFREERLFENREDYTKYMNDVIKKVGEMRLSLQQRGSNLLILNGSYEILIPSVARVLSVDEVIAGFDSTPYNHNTAGLLDFRNRKTGEVNHLLNMHSIAMRTEDQAVPNFVFDGGGNLPAFPSINAGTVPGYQMAEVRNY